MQAYGTMGVENLHVAGLAKGILAKHVQDASWARFLQLLACGTIKKKSLSEREHLCECGCRMHRDTAAAKNISARIEPSGVNVGEVMPCVAWRIPRPQA